MNDRDRLGDPARLHALTRTGLTAAPDETFDRFAQLVQRVLGVPAAVVSLVGADGQILPGARGLAEPWQRRRRTPPSHSFSRHVVAGAAPLIVTDARTDPRVSGNPAVEALGVRAYAGMPLTDAEGAVLGALCAIDHAPRRWTPEELSLLADLAAACSDSLRLRIASWRAESGAIVARAGQRQAGAAFDRSQLLLRASTALTNTVTAEDVLDAVRDLVTGTLSPAYVGLSLVDARGWISMATPAALPAELAARWARYPRAASTPPALAIRNDDMVLLPDPAAIGALTPDAAGSFAEMGWQSCASAPLPGPDGPIGALTFAWKQPYRLDDTERATLAALAGYVTQALSRAGTLADRRTAAATLQKALLTPLPAHDRVRMAARYRPAHHGNHVGGDWYDAISIDERRLALIIGDVTGHSVEAAAAMSQLRSILRTLLVDRQESPSAVLRRLESTSRLLGYTGLASVVLAYLDREPDGGRTLTWSNAGHPPPLLSVPGAAPVSLDGCDPLLGVLHHAPRHHRTVALPPGALLVLHTDGLVERRDRTFDDGVALILRLIEEPSAGVDELADALVAHADRPYEDDVALLVVSVPA